MKGLSRFGRARTHRCRADRVIAILVATCLWGGGIARAETLLMLPASGQNVSAAVVREARAILTERLAAHCAACWVIDRDAYPSGVPLDPAAEVPLAASLGAQALVTLNLAHGALTAPTLTVVTLTLYAFGPGRFPVGYPVRISRTTTAGPEALVPILDEMSRMLLAAGQPVDQTPIIPRVSVAPEPRHFYFGTEVGVTGMMNTAAPQTVWLPRFGLVALYVTPDALVDLRAEVGSQTPEKNVKALGFGAHGRVGKQWFVGGIARWAWQQIEGRGASGPVLQPTLGFLYPIGTWPLLRVDFGYAVSLFSERGLDRLIVGSGAARRSHGPSLAIGIVF